MLDHDRNHAGTGSTEEFSSLVRSAIDGNSRAFEELIRMFQGSIFSMLYARTQSRSDAEDLVQEVFLKAYRSIRSLKNAEVFKPWLYRIAVNSVKDFYRKRRITSLFGLMGQEAGDDYPAVGPDGFDHLASKQFWGRFNAFLKRLPPLQREVFRLRFLDHLNIKEITLVLSRSESSVKTHLYRALERFRSEGAKQGLYGEEAL